MQMPLRTQGASEHKDQVNHELRVGWALDGKGTVAASSSSMPTSSSLSTTLMKDGLSLGPAKVESKILIVH